MVTVFVDASVRPGRTGGVGVVIRIDPPLESRQINIALEMPIPGTLCSNHAEILACLCAARALAGMTELILGLKQTIVTIKTDSAAAVSAVTNPSRVRSQQTRSIAKNARDAWDDLRARGLILGWHLKKIGRKGNPADACAAGARALYGEMFTCPPVTLQKP